MNSPRVRRLRWGLLWSLLVGLALAACGGGPPPSRTPPPEAPTAAPVTPVAGATPDMPVFVPSDAAFLTLVWWTPEWLAPGSGSESQRLLQQLVQEFEAANPDIVIEVIPRPAYGRGGILDFLTLTARAAPAALPDLVSIDVAEARTAVGSHLLQPLDAWLTATDMAGFFPFVAEVGRVDGVWYVLPLVTDAVHLVYDRARLLSPPQTWAETVAAEAVWLFPLSNREGSASDALALHYLSAGGTLTPADGQTARLGREPLLRLLQFYESLREAVGYPANAADLTASDILAAYLRGEAPMAETSATDFWRRRTELAASGFAGLPTMDGARVAVTGGWGLGVTTGDPMRQQAALRFMQWLLEPSRLGRWSRAAGWLPSHPAAWEAWGRDDPYVTFLHDALAVAPAIPTGPRSADARRLLRQAVGEVLTTDAAATDVVNRILDEASR